MNTFRSQSGEVSPAVSYNSEKEGHLFPFVGEKSRCSIGIEYESNGDGTCYVKGKGSCTDSAIVLPIYSPDGDLVTTVGKDNNTLAFSGDTSIECVILSKSIETVYAGSFEGCTNLETLMITNCDTQFILNAISELKYLKKLYYNGTYESFEENGYIFAFQKFGIAPKVFFGFSENLKPELDKKVDIETFTAHEEDTGNPHGVTAEQTGAYDKAAVDEKITAARTEATERSGKISAALSAHEEDIKNPHKVTAEQTGAYNKATVDKKLDKVSGISKDAGKTSIDGTYFPGQKLCTANDNFSYENAVSNSAGLSFTNPYNFNEEFNKTADKEYYGYIRLNKDDCKLSADTVYIMFVKLTISNPSDDISKLRIRDLRRAYNGSERLGDFWYTGLKEGINYVAVPFTVNTSDYIYGIYFDVL